MSLRRTRRTLYRSASLLGDLTALLTISPFRILRRIFNKWIGRNLARKLWR